MDENRLKKVKKDHLTNSDSGDIPHQSLPKSTNKHHWSTKAACADMNGKMFPKGHKDLSYITEARKICRGCPVRKECLEYALTFPASDLHGVWAGLTPRQLAAEAQRRGIKPKRYTLAQVWSAYNKPN